MYILSNVYSFLQPADICSTHRSNHSSITRREVMSTFLIQTALPFPHTVSKVKHFGLFVEYHCLPDSIEQRPYPDSDESDPTTSDAIVLTQPPSKVLKPNPKPATKSKAPKMTAKEKKAAGLGLCGLDKKDFGDSIKECLRSAESYVRI